MADPVTPKPAATSKVEPIIVAPEILPAPSIVKLEPPFILPPTPRPPTITNAPVVVDVELVEALMPIPPVPTYMNVVPETAVPVFA